MPASHGFPYTLQTAPAGGVRIDARTPQDGGLVFAGASLQQADCRGLDLRGINLRGVDARGASFDAAKLQGADFTGALLQGASFRRACLDGVSFRQTLLLSAHLEYASVQNASFAGANLEWAWIEGVDFALATVECAVFLNARGLCDAVRRAIEDGGGFTGTRAMMLGRELYELPFSDGREERSGVGSHA